VPERGGRVSFGLAVAVIVLQAFTLRPSLVNLVVLGTSSVVVAVLRDVARREGFILGTLNNPSNT